MSQSNFQLLHAFISTMNPTKVLLFSHFGFSYIPVEDKLCATYMHACVKNVESDARTTGSLRERFEFKDTPVGNISRVIKEAS